MSIPGIIFLGGFIPHQFCMYTYEDIYFNLWKTFIFKTIRNISTHYF